MKKIAIYDVTDQKLYDELEKWIDNADWHDQIWIDDSGKIFRVDDNLVELFHAQNKDLTGYTRILFGAQID